MAIYHLSVGVITRSSGRSVTAAAAYRAAERIYDERTGLVFDYRRKQSVAWKKIFAPADAPAWTQDRAALYNAVELGEKRKDAQVAREVVVALPHELSQDRQIELLSRFVRRELVAHGMVADVCLHAKDGNHHAHILLSMRTIGPEGFGAKQTEWNRKDFLEGLRSAWAKHCNRRLSVAGAKTRIDHRSLRAQGVERRPTLHEGPTVTAMRRKGRTSHLGEINRLITLENDMEKELQGLTMPDEMPPEVKLKTAGENQLESLDPVDRYDIEAVWYPDYRQRMREVFAGENILIGRGSNFGAHMRMVLPQGGEVRDYGKLIVCLNGSDEEAAVAVKLAQAKGWKGIKVNGSDDYRRAVWLEALRKGFTPDSIRGYSPSAEDLKLASDLSLSSVLPPPRPVALILVAPRGKGSSKQGTSLATPATRRLRK